mmetsp:Transcript_23127/g.50293  ORF Transcript_23127/g.50293 Transcript_23127/m.50293 type:complete len:131 (+) Transcript_23127:2-394(+)
MCHFVLTVASVLRRCGPLPRPWSVPRHFSTHGYGVVDDWDRVELLMSSCWAADEDARPSFPKVLDTLVDNSGSATRVVRSGSDGEDAPLFNKFAPPVEETEDVEMTPGAGERTPPPEQTDKAEDESRSPC